LSFFKKRRIF